MNHTNGKDRPARESHGMLVTPFRAVVMIAVVIVIVIVKILLDNAGPGNVALGPEWQYDLTEERKVDPLLITYEEFGRVATGFEEARGIAIGSDDSLYVAGDNAIRVFDLPSSSGVLLGRGERAVGGSRKAEIQVGGAPQCVAVAADGTLYVGMKDHVEVYEPGGARKATWESLGAKAAITSIAVADEDVFVADARNLIVLRYDTSGSVITRIGKKDLDRNIPGLVAPSPHMDVAIAADGLLRVSNPGRHRIEAYTRDGDLEFSWGETSMGLDNEIEGFCGCCNPTDFAILSNGKVVTGEKGLPRVKVDEDITGELQGVVAAPEAFVEATMYGFGAGFVGFDLAVDSKDRILVLDPSISAVRIFVSKREASNE